ncbi:hypothetical protein [Mycolicibacterium vanbaalenii]|uniref:DUF732 domain-containing protein n=1 Tax=Mycolicibacterium vanbaalenii (strain DSM 7251 / JCM 13017 / BCRC 16820 / KCTC 9966 / NRRL B-24157 / PYR-1) TaxID=350058 RepID=A1TBX0_MYCVP|nr:hypothetical protein [Mycolicibacterium vanbaalenii]ABM14670.1 hypothetical protein Mvan_3891 [Mycolicibacterium vanbaalenii PYR-1]MCV7130798.1 hypothetical protein [Mycolicibacterium vanbaalenii PYR-1]
MKVYVLGAALSVVAPLLIVTAPGASASPDCDSFDPTGPACPSRPTGNCNPYDSSGQGFLGCLGSNWDDEPTTGVRGGVPTITNPQDVYAANTSDMYRLICNDLDVNGVSVRSTENIYHVLYAAPYNMAGRDAGQAVRRALKTTCPEHESAMDQAVKEALS